jgi:hypothetical protein
MPSAKNMSFGHLLGIEDRHPSGDLGLDPSSDAEAL